jgi:hypothetical protein
MVKYLELNTLEAAGCKRRGQDAEPRLSAAMWRVPGPTANTYTGKS